MLSKFTDAQPKKKIVIEESDDDDDDDLSDDHDHDTENDGHHDDDGDENNQDDGRKDYGENEVFPPPTETIEKDRSGENGGGEIGIEGDVGAAGASDGNEGSGEGDSSGILPPPSDCDDGNPGEKSASGSMETNEGAGFSRSRKTMLVNNGPENIVGLLGKQMISKDSPVVPLKIMKKK